MKPIWSDSVVIIYWEKQDIQAGAAREMGFAYGLGCVSGAEGGGHLAVTVGGSFKSGEEFTVTAYINDPISSQTVTLQLPPGLELSAGDVAQSVPAVLAGASTRNSLVTWKVKPARIGRYTIRVQSSTGAAQTQSIVIKDNALFD